MASNYGKYGSLHLFVWKFQALVECNVFTSCNEQSVQFAASNLSSSYVMSLVAFLIEFNVCYYYYLFGCLIYPDSK